MIATNAAPPEDAAPDSTVPRVTRSPYFDEHGRPHADLIDGIGRRLAIKNAKLRARWRDPRRARTP